MNSTKMFAVFREMISLLCVFASVLHSPGAFGGSTAREAFGVFDLPNDTRAFDELDHLGVEWVRLQFRVGEADPAAFTQRSSQLFSRGYGLWLTLYQRNPTNSFQPTDVTPLPSTTRGSYPALNPADYQAAVAELVQTLRQQMITHDLTPGERLVIQICNEVRPKELGGDNPFRFWHGSSNEYLAALTQTREAVQSVDQTIPTAAGGISSAVMEGILEGEEDIAAWNDLMLRSGQFDWADIHVRHRLETVAARVQWVRERWDGPLAATEFAGPDPRTGAICTEATQAEDLPLRMEATLQAGVDRVFWASLVENPSVEEVFFKEGLLELDTWRRKPVFTAYRDFINATVLRQLRVTISLDSGAGVRLLLSDPGGDEVYTIESSPDLSAWSAVGNITMSDGTGVFTDTLSPLEIARFFRFTVPSESTP